jgi:uncharacterized protein YndB with AHSA1/START domain
MIFMPKFQREVEINAPVEKVWGVITNPQNWPQWFPGIESITGSAVIREGEAIEWRSEGKVGHAKVVNMEPMKRLEVRTQIGEDEDEHVFVLHPSGGFLGLNADECKVEYTLDTLMGGGILGSFIAGGNPKDALAVKNTTNRLRKLVENL